MNDRLRSMIYISLCAVLMAVCAWISIPSAVPFSMQTFALFLTLLLLGGKRAAAAVAVYLLLGAAGLPVFSSFTGGVSVLLGATGGYLSGFLLTALCYWGVTRVFGEGLPVCVAALVLGLLLCYGAGTAWYVGVYAKGAGGAGLAAAVSSCVLPFVVPDMAKLALAIILGGRLKKHIAL